MRKAAVFLLLAVAFAEGQEVGLNLLNKSRRRSGEDRIGATCKPSAVVDIGVAMEGGAAGCGRSSKPLVNRSFL